MKDREVRNALLGLLIVLGLFLPVTVGSQGRAVKVGELDPLTASSFSIAIDGYEIARFSELVSLRTGWELEDFEVAARRIRVGNRVPPSMILTRGQTTSMEMWAWHEAALLNSETSRKNVVLTMYDTAGQPVARYYLENAWPAKIEIGALKAGASSVLTESVTFVFERIQRVNV